MVVVVVVVVGRWKRWWSQLDGREEEGNEGGKKGGMEEGMKEVRGEFSFFYFSLHLWQQKS